MMKFSFIFLIVLCFALVSCDNDSSEKNKSIEAFNFEAREKFTPLKDSLKSGKTYLSVYSQIYSRTEKNLRNLTATVSIRNTSQTDTLLMNQINYFGSAGKLIKSYISKSIYILPLETAEIIIEEDEVAGGTGGNFMFDWSIAASSSKPLFECVMISTAGQQGISFVTTGVDL